jgi:hypothetical protein
MSNREFAGYFFRAMGVLPRELSRKSAVLAKMAWLRGKVRL